MCAVEFVADKDSWTYFDMDKKISYALNAALLKRGIISRAMPEGDILGFAPPFCLTHEEVDEIAEKLKESVREVLG